MAKLRDLYKKARAAIGLDDEQAEADQPKAFNEEEFISEARALFRIDLDADATDRQEAEDDNTFANASDLTKEQWDPVMRDQRVAMNRPVMQRNLMPSFIAQIVNEGAKNDPATKVDPGDQATPETAEYYQGRIRNVEYESDASTAWDTARDQQVTSGRAFIRLDTEYLGPRSFKQRPTVDCIQNQFAVVWPAGAQVYDGEDWGHCFVLSKISKAEHTRRYGKRTTVESMPFEELAQLASDWIGVSSNGADGDLIQVADYYKKHYRMRKLVKLHNGKELYEDELPKRSLVPLSYADEREEACLDGVRLYEINGVEILRRKGQKKLWKECLTDDIPIVPLWGPRRVVKGQFRTTSLIRPAKDEQRLVNYYESCIAETVGQIPRSPWLVEFGSIPANWMNAWINVNSEPTPLLMWLGVDPATGRQLQQPKRELFSVDISGVVNALQIAVDGMKAAMGIFDAARGAQSNETSGIAIQRRQIQSGIVNYHFPRNENRSRKRVGEILLKMISKLDEAGGEYPVREYDGTVRYVPVGKEYEDHKTGKKVTHDLSKGIYGLRIETGLNFTSAKSEENARLTEIIKAWPELMLVFGDNFLRTSDFPGAGENADRMKRYIEMKNPGVIPPEPGQQRPIPPEIEKEFTELMRKAQEAEDFAQQQFQKVQTDEVKQKAETDRKVIDIEFQREKMQAELDFKREELSTKTNLELAKLGQVEATAELKATVDVLNKQAGIEDQVAAREHAGTMDEAARDHESSEAQQAREHEAAQADANRQNQSESQAAEHDLQREMAERSESADES